jgi:AAA domain
MAYEAIPATRKEETLLLGIIGPPGGGKTLSSLKLAKGVQSVRGGDIVVIDTEAGRSRKYNDLIPFKIVELPPAARSNDFLDCIRAQLPAKPAAIVVDSMSDEHLTYLEWHDEEVPNFSGNEWAAWSKPSAARRKLIAGILKIKTPLIFTFRAKEKTKQEGRKIINIGWQPVAPLEIVHTLDLACLLPPRADGVPVWKSDKIGEDFVLKLPNYLAPFIEAGTPLNEQMGAAFARWAQGGAAAPAPSAPAGAADNLAECDLKLADAAKIGSFALAECWRDIPKALKPQLKAALDRRHKPAAEEADARVEAEAAT